MAPISRSASTLPSVSFQTTQGPDSEKLVELVPAERRRAPMGFGFFDEAPTSGPFAPAGIQMESGWSISVTRHLVGKSSKAVKRGGKAADPALTIYISTPTANMTLARQYHELAELDARLRNQIPSRLPLKLPLVTPPIVKKRNVLATISRTLSPRRSPTFESGLATKGVAPKPIESTTLDLVELNSYLNGLAADTIVREHPAFKHFVTTRADDLESERVERRIKRTRSDLTTHLTPSRDASTDRDVMSTSEDSVSDVVDTSAATHLSLPPIHEITASPEKTKGRRELSSATDLTTASSEMDTSSRPSTVELGEGTKEMEGSKVSDARTRSVSKQSVMMTVDSFEILRVLGKGCAGKVLLVRQRETLELFALKAITKQHVLAHRELDHTRTEQSVLKRCSRDHTNPFVVKLHASFHDSETLYLALEFHPGGDLATQLARWGRLGRDRARFYTAEIVEGVEGLHRAGVIYRDLKPENILISQEGHVVLTDFGLSKDFEHARIAEGGKGDLGWVSSRSVSAPVSWMASRRETTSTFCGTAEYLAPEVLLGEPYSYEVDSWSLGTMLYEMLSGLTPFWSEDHATMYRRVLHSDLTFDDDARIFDDDTKSLLRGLLQRNPLLRMTDERIKRHPYFSMIEWSHVFHKRYVPPYIPALNKLDPSDTSQFDDVFLTMEAKVGAEETGAIGEERDPPEGEPQAATDDLGRDVFDGYSFYGNDGDSVLSGTVEEDVDPSSDLEVTTTSSDLDHSPTSLHHQPSLGLLTEASSESLDQAAGSDDEWDVIDVDVGGEARNGGKGTAATLWSRGVKDKYRLLVTSTPRNSSPLRSSNEKEKYEMDSPQTGLSPARTPESRISLRRLGSYRSGTSSKAKLTRSQLSLQSLKADGEETGKGRMVSSVSTSAIMEGTPRTRRGAGETLKRMTMSAFRPRPSA